MTMKLTAWLSVLALLGAAAPLWAQDAGSQGPDAEYKVLVEVTQGTGQATDKTVLSATARMGARAEGETLLGAVGAGPGVEYGCEFTVSGFEHDAWRNLVVSAQSGCWVRTGAPPKEDEEDGRPEVSVKGSGLYALRPGVRLKLLEMALAQPAGPARVVRLYVTATAEPAAR
jgi:hypothetical protein